MALLHNVTINHQSRFQQIQEKMLIFLRLLILPIHPVSPFHCVIKLYISHPLYGKFHILPKNSTGNYKHFTQLSNEPYKPLTWMRVVAFLNSIVKWDVKGQQHYWEKKYFGTNILSKFQEITSTAEYNVADLTKSSPLPHPLLGHYCNKYKSQYWSSLWQ